MPLPTGLERDLRDGDSTTQIDVTESIRRLEALLGNEPPFNDYVIWRGPAFGDHDLVLDVYLVGLECLYNYSVYLNDAFSLNSTFLDVIEWISIQRINDERSPLVMSVWYAGEERSRIYGKEGDLHQLEDLRQTIIANRGKLRRP